MKGAALSSFVFLVLVLGFINSIQAQNRIYGKNTYMELDTPFYDLVASRTDGNYGEVQLFYVSDVTGASFPIFTNFNGTVRETGSGYVVNNLVTPSGNTFKYQVTVSQEIPAISFLLTLVATNNSVASVIVDFLYHNGALIDSGYDTTTITSTTDPDMYIVAHAFANLSTNEVYFDYDLRLGQSVLIIVYLGKPGEATTWNPPSYLKDATFLSRSDLLPGLSLANLEDIVNWEFYGFNVASYTQICQFPNEIRNRNGANNRKQQRHPFTEAWVC